MINTLNNSTLNQVERYIAHGKTRNGLIEKLRSRGFDIQQLNDIPKSLKFNPANLYYDECAMAKRFELAHVMKSHYADLGHDTDISSCYFGLDKMLNEEYEGEYMGEHQYAYSILNHLHDFVKKPEAGANNLKLRMEYGNIYLAAGSSIITGMLASGFLFNGSLKNMITGSVITAGTYLGYHFMSSFLLRDLLNGVNNKRDPTFEPFFETVIRERRELYIDTTKFILGINPLD